MLNFFKPYTAGAFSIVIWVCCYLASGKLLDWVHLKLNSWLTIFSQPLRCCEFDLQICKGIAWGINFSRMIPHHFLALCIDNFPYSLSVGMGKWLIHDCLDIKVIGFSTNSFGTMITSLDFYFHLDCGMIIPFYFVSYLYSKKCYFFCFLFNLSL